MIFDELILGVGTQQVEQTGVQLLGVGFAVDVNGQFTSDVNE